MKSDVYIEPINITKKLIYLDKFVKLSTYLLMHITGLTAANALLRVIDYGFEQFVEITYLIGLVVFGGVIHLIDFIVKPQARRTIDFKDTYDLISKITNSKVRNSFNHTVADPQPEIQVK